MSSRNKPFGMLFEEDAHAESPFAVAPEYDPLESLSYIIDSSGKRIPFILQDWTLAQTQTATLVQAEGSDSDQAQPGTGTQTATKVLAEGSDDDAAQFSVLATATETRVQAESGDTDVNRSHCALATQTLSEVRAESTDAD